MPFKRGNCVLGVVASAMILLGAAFPPLSARGQSVRLVGQEVFVPPDDLVLDGPPPEAMLDRAGPLIHLGAARQKYPTITGGGYTVAILDTGVDRTHPALAGRYVGGYDYANNDSNPDDDNGHGTHVAGIALSADANYRGIAPEASYAAVKVLSSSGFGAMVTIEKGLQWVIDNRATYNIVAVNLSLGTSAIYNSPHYDILSEELLSLKNAGVFIAAAAGNSWYAEQPNQGVVYPAADGSAVAVGDVWTADFGPINWTSGAKDYTTAADRIVSHCNRSTTMLDLFAPGAIITSANYAWEGNSPDWVVKGGTSMAAPAVAGLAVLIREAIEENWDPSQWPSGAGWEDTILQIMQATGVTVRDGDDEDDNVTNLDFDFKRIDVLAALDYAVPEPGSIVLSVFTACILLRRKRRMAPR